jgi:phosphatidylethanolamine/phosphatidyl-N-methylethanolamine N-methyltransferase
MGRETSVFEDVRLFYSEFRHNFGTTGAIAPSSPLLGKAMTRPLSQRTVSPIRVLEVGAGTGAFTGQILKYLAAGDLLDIYELNPRFYDFLQHRLPLTGFAARGIQCRLHNADVREMERKLEYDYIICGLPFNNFEPETVSEIFEALIGCLSPSGVFSYFEYIFSHEFKAKFLKPSDRERMMRVGFTVRSFIQRHQYGSHQVWLNFPPAKARYCRRLPVSSALFRQQGRPPQ